MNRRLNRMAGDIDALRARSAALTRRITALEATAIQQTLTNQRHDHEIDALGGRVRALEAAAAPLCAPVAAATPPDGATCQTEPQTAQTGTYDDGYRAGWNDARWRNALDGQAPPITFGAELNLIRANTPPRAPVERPDSGCWP